MPRVRVRFFAPKALCREPVVMGNGPKERAGKSRAGIETVGWRETIEDGGGVMEGE